MAAWSERSPSYCSSLGADPDTSHWCAKKASRDTRGAGQNREGLSPRSNHFALFLPREQPVYRPTELPTDSQQDFGPDLLLPAFDCG